MLLGTLATVTTIIDIILKLYLLFTLSIYQYSQPIWLDTLLLFTFIYLLNHYSALSKCLICLTSKIITLLHTKHTPYK